MSTGGHIFWAALLHLVGVMAALPPHQLEVSRDFIKPGSAALGVSGGWCDSGVAVTKKSSTGRKS